MIYNYYKRLVDFSMLGSSVLLWQPPAPSMLTSETHHVTLFSKYAAIV